MGVAVGVAAGGMGVGMGNGVEVAEGAISVGVDGFVGSGFGGSFVGESSTSSLATTLPSGVEVSAVCVSPQAIHHRSQRASQYQYGCMSHLSEQ